MAIVDSGEIRPATALVPAGEKPCVWFSKRRDWEPTANKLWVSGGVTRSLTMRETGERGGGLVRFGVAPETAPYDWAAYRRLSGVPKSEAGGLARHARDQGADPRHWYVSFAPVPRALWRSVDVYEWKNTPSGVWSPVPIAAVDHA
jgi:hypothetical protein